MLGSSLNDRLNSFPVVVTLALNIGLVVTGIVFLVSMIMALLPGRRFITMRRRGGKGLKLVGHSLQVFMVIPTAIILIVLKARFVIVLLLVLALEAMALAIYWIGTRIIKEAEREKLQRSESLSH
jgi:hypothetical protein